MNAVIKPKQPLLANSGDGAVLFPISDGVDGPDSLSRLSVEEFLKRADTLGEVIGRMKKEDKHTCAEET